MAARARARTRRADSLLCVNIKPSKSVEECSLIHSGNTGGHVLCCQVSNLSYQLLKITYFFTYCLFFAEYGWKFRLITNHRNVSNTVKEPSWFSHISFRFCVHKGKSTTANHMKSCTGFTPWMAASMFQCAGYESIIMVYLRVPFSPLSRLVKRLYRRVIWLWETGRKTAKIWSDKLLITR